MSLTCVRGCVRSGEHLAACPCADPQHEHGIGPVDMGAEQRLADGEIPFDEAPAWYACPSCTGCLPRLAAPGLAICWTDRNHAERDLTELPDLWADLAERPRLAGVTSAPDSEGDSPPDPMTDNRRHARSAIKAMLVTWCLTLAEDYAITIPDEAEIARTSRTIAAWHSDQAAQAQQAVRLLEMPTAGPLVRDPEGAAVLRTEVKRQTADAAKVRNDRETGRDILAALAAHIGRHLDTLLAGEHADQLCADLTNAASEARRCAYPGRPDTVTIPCPSCGQRSRVAPDDRGDITCPRCQDKGDAAWWGMKANAEPLNISDLRRYLSNEGLHPTERQLRSWADKGVLVSTRPGRGPDGKMQDRLFDPIASVRVVAEILDKKRHERRVA